MSVLPEDRFRWEGVAVRRYKDADGTHHGVSRQVLLGESAGQEPLRFVTRYFEVAPGGYTSLERHGHPHAVVVLRGRGSVVLDEARAAIAPFDCVYVAPRVAHQFMADQGEALGFLCVVDRVRDQPVPVSPTRRRPRSSGP